MKTAEAVLQLYREKYFDFNVRHFHEKLTEEHDIRISYTWVKTALQGAGLVKKQRRRGTHRRRRPRRPLPGMMLHIDASKHAWFGDGRYYDLITILDDATSEIYYAQLVAEEGTRTLLPAVRQVIQQQGIFCALYSDRASHFFVTPKAGGKVDESQVTQFGRALKELGIKMIPAYSPQARGRMERSYRTWPRGRVGYPRNCDCARSRRWRRRTGSSVSGTRRNSTGLRSWRPVRAAPSYARGARIWTGCFPSSTNVR
jgi:hypothetical protein